MANKCNFCGRKESDVTILVQGLEGHICDNCALRAWDIVNLENKDTKKETAKETFTLKEVPAPKAISKHLDQYVIGQEKAKRLLSVAVHNH